MAKNKGKQFKKKKIEKAKIFTVIRHVKSEEASVGVSEHGINSFISVDSAPTTAGLPHPVQYSANF